jgi:hypothetical protein
MSVGPFTHLGRQGPRPRFVDQRRVASSRRRLSAIIDDTDAQSSVHSVGDRGAKSSQPAPPGAPGGGPTVDEMSECSFPASDPPAVWTWEPKAPRLETGEPRTDMAADT